MSSDEPERLPTESPMALQEAIDKIPPGGQAYVTFEDLRQLSGQTCEEFIADNERLMGRTPKRLTLEPNDIEQRLYFVRKKSN
jgi:hypothetical protein